MSKTSDDLAAVKQNMADVGTAISAISTSVTGIAGDVTSLNAQILALQNSGSVPPEIQDAVSQLVTDSGALKTNADAAAAALATLDAQTPPAS